jgi:glutaminyl-tRNA synthetase
VSAAHAVDAESAASMNRPFNVPEPDADGDFKAHLNPIRLETVSAKCEPRRWLGQRQTSEYN